MIHRQLVRYESTIKVTDSLGRELLSPAIESVWKFIHRHGKGSHRCSEESIRHVS